MSFTSFMNGYLAIGGELVSDQLVVSEDTGLILPRTGYIGGDAVDLEEGIIAPGFLELQTNGLLGFHFTHFTDEKQYAEEVDKAAKYLVTQGVTGFWGTVPTVSSDEFQKILPSLKPREIDGCASLLGAHAEGPYLHASKKGAHNASLFKDASSPPSSVYGPTAKTSETLKLVTVAPDVPSSTTLIKDLTAKGIKVSLGHSSATYTQGLEAIEAGASALTHTLNAMTPLHHRESGLAGLITMPAPQNEDKITTSPYYSIIPDGHHLHPTIATLLFRANPQKCIFVTDSVELAGLDDGVYPGHAQIAHAQRKQGSRVTIDVDGTETLVGGCASLQACVRNVMRWSGCGVAEAVRCVTENVADLMGDGTRGKLEAGRRADFVVMNAEGEVLQTWVAGVKVWERR